MSLSEIIIILRRILALLHLNVTGWSIIADCLYVGGANCYTTDQTDSSGCNEGCIVGTSVGGITLLVIEVAVIGSAIHRKR